MKARRGDREAIDVLVRQYQEVAFRTAFLVTRDAEDARDAAQSAMINAIGSLPRFREDSPFRPWLMRIVVNEAKDLRSASIRRATTPIDAESQEPMSSRDMSPETSAELSEERELLLAAVNALRLNDGLVIAHRYFLCLSEAEMSVALDCPRGTVKSRLSRSLARLRDVLASDLTLEPGDRTHG